MIWPSKNREWTLRELRSVHFIATAERVPGWYVFPDAACSERQSYCEVLDLKHYDGLS